jgi:hypothetical protein
MSPLVVVAAAGVLVVFAVCIGLPLIIWKVNERREKKDAE